MRIAAHQRDIWLDIVSQALRRFDIDLRFLFYDLTALVLQGAYTDSQLVGLWLCPQHAQRQAKDQTRRHRECRWRDPGRLCRPRRPRRPIMATVQENMARLCRLLERQGQPLSEVLLIGDRANLNDELALAYTDKQLKYLAGLAAT